MRDAIKSSREGGWYNAYTGPASTLAFRNGWLISHGRAPKKRFASTRRGVLFLFLFLSLSLSLSPTSRTGLFSVLSCGSLWLACAVICATERVGYLIKIGLFSCIPVHALPEKTLSPFAHSLSLLLFLSLFVGFRRVIDSALRLSTAGYEFSFQLFFAHHFWESIPP